jgi:hypothetical protein
VDHPLAGRIDLSRLLCGAFERAISGARVERRLAVNILWYSGCALRISTLILLCALYSCFESSLRMFHIAINQLDGSQFADSVEIVE